VPALFSLSPNIYQSRDQVMVYYCDMPIISENVWANCLFPNYMRV
jgi:hypothetical protein